MTLVAVPLIAALLSAATPRIAVMPLTATSDIPTRLPVALTDVVAAEVRRVSGARIVTQSDIAAMLSLEQQKAMLGCSEDVGCLAQIGGALGVERIVQGSVSKIGSSWLLHLGLIDVKRSQVLERADRRLKGADEEAMLDALPEMVAQLFKSREAPPQAAQQQPAPAEALLAQPAAQATASDAADESHLAPWIVTGAGAAALVVGLLMSEPWAKDASFQSGGYSVYPEVTREEATKINSRRNTGAVVAAAGAATAAGGLVWRFAF